MLTQCSLETLQPIGSHRSAHHRLGVELANAAHERHRIVHGVDLVEHRHHRPVGHLQLCQHLIHHHHLLLELRVAGVDHVEQQIGLPSLLKRGPETGHQMVRQLANEPDRVRHPGPVPLAQIHLAGKRVERGEQPVIHYDFVSPAQAAQQTRLAGVGVPHQGDRHHRGPTRSNVFSVLGHVLELGLEPADLLPYHPPVGLQLRLTRPP